MPYASLADLTARFGEATLVRLTDRSDVATGLIDQTVVDEALEDTDAVIDGFISGRYAMPVATVPPLINDLAKAIAFYKLHVFTPDQKVRDDYKDAMRQLEQIAAGTIQLPLATGEPAESTDAGEVRVNDRERPFTEDNLKGFI